MLEAPDSTVVTFQYPLAVPSANLFSTWQLEAMTDYFNAQIATAVANTKAALPGQAQRLVLIEAQTDPAARPPRRCRASTWACPRTASPGTRPTTAAGLFNDFVDGQSHQSKPTQDEFLLESPRSYCSGPEWIIGADSGIHPNSEGYSQFVEPLAGVVSAPRLPPRR